MILIIEHNEFSTVNYSFLLDHYFIHPLAIIKLPFICHEFTIPHLFKMHSLFIHSKFFHSPFIHSTIIHEFV